MLKNVKIQENFEKIRDCPWDPKQPFLGPIKMSKFFKISEIFWGPLRFHVGPCKTFFRPLTIFNPKNLSEKGPLLQRHLGSIYLNKIRFSLDLFYVCLVWDLINVSQCIFWGGRQLKVLTINAQQVNCHNRPLSLSF